MQRKSITTSHKVLACDVCGRTLLRGEHPDAFIAGGTRRLVCDLCTARATHEGWIREGLDDVGTRAGGRERGSLLQRLRARREAAADRRGREARRSRADAAPAPEPAAVSAPAPTWADEDPAPGGWDAPAGAVAAWSTPPAAAEPGHQGWEAPEAPPAAWSAPDPPPPAPRRPEPVWQPPREPRHVHAVPTNAELKMARALELFNASEHPRVVAGVARSLGPPLVAVKPSATEGSIVTLVVGWELCWYRYEVDLADEASGVRAVAQGAELDELDPDERVANATADERGALALSAA
jgi:hypothetical protein